MNATVSGPVTIIREGMPMVIARTLNPVTLTSEDKMTRKKKLVKTARTKKQVAKAVATIMVLPAIQGKSTSVDELKAKRRAAALKAWETMRARKAAKGGS